MNMTPLSRMRRAVSAGNGDPVARAAVAAADILESDFRAASNAELRRLRRELAAVVACADWVLVERFAPGGAIAGGVIDRLAEPDQEGTP